MWSWLICAHHTHAGALFAIVTSVQVLCASFSSVLYNTVYQKSLADHLNAGLAFIIMGILGLVPVPLVVWVRDSDCVDAEPKRAFLCFSLQCSATVQKERSFQRQWPNPTGWREGAASEHPRDKRERVIDFKFRCLRSVLAKPKLTWETDLKCFLK